MPRFVLLRHECPPNFPKPSHWDLMLEQQGVLQTWEVQTLPAAWAGHFGGEKSAEKAVPIRLLPDHRIDYLDYEGPISNDRGRVERCDRGAYVVLDQDDGSSKLELSGAVLNCVVQLQRQKDEWLLQVVDQ